MSASSNNMLKENHEIEAALGNVIVAQLYLLC